MSSTPTGSTPTGSTLPPVTTPTGLTPTWLTAALRAGGSIGSTTTVTGAATEPVGTGQMGESYRVFLDYSGAPGPATVVAKMPTANVASRALVAGAYRTEVGYYRDIASTVAIRSPACSFSAINEDGTEFVLLLEDLAPAVPGDQVAGCGVRDALGAVENLAGLHGPRWGDPTVHDITGLSVIGPKGASMLAPAFVDATETFLTRFGSRLDDQDHALLRDVAAAIGPWITDRSARVGLMHGDYRLDNLLFLPGAPSTSSTPTVTAVDWQTLSLGLPARDLSYFLGTGLDPALRRTHEEDLVGAYHRGLLRHGVSDYPFRQCFEDYRFGHLQGPLIIAFGAAYGTRTGRGDDMFTAMTIRSCAAIRELDSLSLIDA